MYIHVYYSHATGVEVVSSCMCACRKQVTGAPYGVSYGGGEERESQ